MTRTSVGWGIVGPGGISKKFARDLRIANGGHLQAVAGRNLDRAKAFATEFSAEFAFDDLLSLATEPSVDIVYIATPHNAHFEAAKLLLQHGKPVLIEKPLAINAAQAQELIAIARAKRVFLMEAMWTRFLPVYRHLEKWLADGRIGNCRLVASNFCVRIEPPPSSRLLNPNLAGGGLLDLGVYNLAMTRLILGGKPDKIQAIANFSPAGVDEMLSVTLGYPQNALAQFSCGFGSHGDNSLTVCGEEGRISIPARFTAAQEATLTVGSHVETVCEPFRGEGFEYEIEEAMRCLQTNEIESPLMPLDDTLATVETMDAIRAIIGLRYPFESKQP